jgi:multiple sugar transport system permease protein/raffinose/stachyose/melibiose transport system permease protein
MSDPADTPKCAARQRWLRQALASVILCGPAVVLYGGFIVFPAILGFAYSFTNWTGWTGHPSFVGLDNFRDLAGDGKFFDAVRFTLFETALIVLFFTFASMVLAIALDSLRVMKGLIRGLFFYPYVLSILVSALLFQYLANYREGAINTILRALHLDVLTQDWMGQPDFVPYFIFALVAWSGVGFFTTLYLANLQTIPTELYEAARIDGAGPLSVFTRIQFPMLLPTLTTNSVLALITGINLFPQIVVTTQGGPGFRTFTIGYYIYHLGVLNNRQGYAAAVSFVTFAALVAVAAVQVTLLRRRQVAL